MNVELDAIGSEVDRADEPGDRVLGMRLVRAPVGDSLGGIASSAYGQ
jgi:hypothetical protein